MALVYGFFRQYQYVIWWNYSNLIAWDTEKDIKNFKHNHFLIAAFLADAAGKQGFFERKRSETLLYSECFYREWIYLLTKVWLYWCPVAPIHCF